MKRILVDFNTVMQDEAQGNRVTLGRVEDVASQALPELRVGERVIAYDDEMAVEGVVERDGAFWVAALDWTTQIHATPQR